MYHDHSKEKKPAVDNQADIHTMKIGHCSSHDSVTKRLQVTVHFTHSGTTDCNQALLSHSSAFQCDENA